MLRARARAAVAPIIALTTDFGLRDPYVAEMKAVILGIAAGRPLHLVDVTHDVGCQDIVEGALALEAAAPWFPPGTVHLAVVDPGVGTARRALAVAAREQVFIGPDNGLFTPLLTGAWRAWELSEPAYRAPTVSATFHGRDVFAPAAAHVACGLDPARLGPPVADPVRVPWPGARVVREGIAGVVLHVDRFGNLVSSIRADALVALGDAPTVRVAARRLPLVPTYGALAPGRAGALVGSGGRLEIAVRDGSAAARLGAGRGATVTVLRARGGVSRTSSSRSRRRRTRRASSTSSTRRRRRT